MKRLWMAVFALLIILMLCLMHIGSVRRHTGDLTEGLSRAQSLLKDGDRAEANAEMQRMLAQAEQWVHHMHSLVNHAMLDTMLASLIDATAELQAGRDTDFVVQCSVLEAMIEHIYEIERLSWQNIW